MIGPGTSLADRYVVEKLTRKTRFAEVYQATDQTSNTPVSIHVIDPKLARVQRIAEVVAAASRAAIAIDHKNVVRTLDFCTDVGGHTFVVTEYLEGNPLRELIERKQDTGSPGFGARGANNILGGVCDALEAAHTQANTAHGAISVDSVYVNKAGRVKVADFGLGAALPAAVHSGVQTKPTDMAPEVAKSGHPLPSGDLFSLGMLLYQVLVGKELVKGGPRPSEVDQVGSGVDELVARCAAPQPGKRPKSADTFKSLLVTALKRPTAERPAVKPEATPKGKARPSLAQAIATPAVPTKESEPFLQAIAQNDEKFLVSKGKLDYGPFTLAHIIEDINANLVVPGHVIIDKDTGERVNVEDHPLLAELVDEAKQRRDDQRRAQAEVAHSEQEKRRGFALYLFIAAAVLGVGGSAFLIYRSLRSTSFSPTVIAQNGEGTTTWEYAIVVITEDGANRKVSKKRTLSKGVDKLSDKTFNRITWPEISGAVRYEIYRTGAGGSPDTTGRIASVEPTVLQIDDTGLEGDGTTIEARLSALEEGSLQARITFPEPPSKRPHKRRHGKRHGSAGDDDDEGPGGPVDFSKEGGSEILDGSQINPVIQRHGGKLARCLLSKGASRADIEFSIKNTGRVSRVTVYGANPDATSCIEKVVKSMKFPRFDGTFTNASFDMSL